MFKHFEEYGYLGIFTALIASGLGLPIPEEVPVLTAGALAGHEDTPFKWYIMLPVVITGVVIGDGFLYGLGRLWGARFLDSAWVRRRIVTPEKRAKIEKNFHERGIAVLLGARLLPGIRTPIFIIAGALRVPLGRFLLADGLYAIPGVNLLFWLAYLLTDQVVEIVKKLEQYRPLVVVLVLSGVVGALIQKYAFNRKVSTGDPPHVPQIISRPAEAVVHVVEKAAEAVVHAAHVGHRHDTPEDPPPDPASDIHPQVEPVDASPPAPPAG
jgi:membrane protein DedA with SNARE-associated domain